MKRILILHAHNTYNYGSFMMCVNLINYLSEKMGNDCVFYVDLIEKQDYVRLKNSVHGSCEIKKVSFVGEMIKRGPLGKLWEKFSNEAKRIEALSPDAIVVLGGDDLSEYYSIRNLFFELRKLSILSKKFPVFLVGQTIGPFTSWRKSFASKVLKKCKIYTRDSLNVEYLKKELGLKDIFESSDLAFLDLPRQKEASDLFKKHGLKENGYVVLVPSGLVGKYTENNDEYLKGWLEIVKSILLRNDLKDKKIVLLPHVLKPAKCDDRNVISEILERLSDDEKKRILYLNEELLPFEARGILGGGFFTITGRMHAAISTFQVGKPAISLSYSIKYAGIIGRDLKRGDLIIESADSEIWRSLEIVKELEKKIDFLMTDYKRIVVEIKKEMEELKGKTILQLKDIADLLKDRE